MGSRFGDIPTAARCEFGATMSYLGIDLGTSGLRALLIDEDGKPIGASESTYGVSNPFKGWSEQDPSLWIAALHTCIRDLLSRFPNLRDLRGIGISGHMHGATLLDAEGKVLRPCILWNDTRADHEAAKLDAIEAFRRLSGNIVFPGFTAPKLDWVRNNEPETFARVSKVLLPAAYLSYYLTGQYSADMSDSSGTAWLDVGKRAWSGPLLRASGMTEAQMPSLREGTEVAGTLRAELQQEWGLSKEVVVCAGSADNAAAACGVGALRDGEGFVSLGTSGVVLVARDSYCPAPETAVHTFCHAVPDRWYQMGVMLAATDSLNWLSRITGATPAHLTGNLGNDVRPPGGVRFLPYLSGERTPHNDAQIRGSFTGLSTATDHNDLTRAVLEGVSFGLRDSLEALASTGAKVRALTVVGGGSASNYWLKLLATILGVPLHRPSGSENGAALGAARLALIAATGSDPQSVITAPDLLQTVEPDESQAPEFEAAYQRFRHAYPAMKIIQ